MEGKKSAFSIESILSNNISGVGGSNVASCNSSPLGQQNHRHHQNCSKISNHYCEPLPVPVMVKIEPSVGCCIGSGGGGGSSSGDESYDYAIGQEEDECSRSDRFKFNNNNIGRTIQDDAHCSSSGMSMKECKDATLKGLCSSHSSASTLLVDDADSTVDMSEEQAVKGSGHLNTSHDDFQDIEDDEEDNGDLCQEDCRDEEDQRVLSGMQKIYTNSK